MAKHYQDHPAFIGPRLPKEHPAYLAFLDKIKLTPIPSAILSQIIEQERARFVIDELDVTAFKSNT